MLELPSAEKSYWKESYPKPVYPELTEDLQVDVVIVGGGIAGLTAAYLLKQAGYTVAALEKNTIGSGTTGGTTGKVTSQHGLNYARLKNDLGEKTARIYAEANHAAVEHMAYLIKKEKIDCAWQRDDNYVYTVDPGKVEQFKEEAAISASLGLPASFETKLDLPFEVKAAVKFSNQAKFNAQKYVLGLAKSVDGQGSYVFENSNAIRFHDGSPAKVATRKASVVAADIIVATKVPAAPLAARITYAALEHPHTSYIVAGKLDRKLEGMYISPDKEHYSILPLEIDRQRLLLIGGENHTPGLGNPKRRYQKLADYAEKHFGVSALRYRWKAMDYIAYDEVPLIGKVYPWSEHLYTATGFKKWGLSTSMVAGMILRDSLDGRPNPWAHVFTSSRVKPLTSIPRTIARSMGR